MKSFWIKMLIQNANFVSPEKRSCGKASTVAVSSLDLVLVTRVHRGEVDLAAERLVL